MKGNELDDLFRQKLGQRKLTPPASSWEQIEGNLSKTKGKAAPFWMKIAAALALIFTLGWLVLPLQDDGASKATAELQDGLTTESADLKADANEEAKEVITPTPEIEEKEPVIKEPLQQAPKTLLAQNTPSEEAPVTQEPEVVLTERELFHVQKINLKHAVARSPLTPSFREAHVLPLDLSLMFNYSEEGDEEFKNRRKFRVLNGIISIAKGVNKSKLGFEEIRNAKNGFINDNLKYGVQEDEEAETKQVGEDGKNAGDLNKNAQDFK